MPEMVLATSDDLVGRLAHEGDPVRAVVELVWNSIDAEGTDIVVVLQRDSSEGIIATQVIDDGVPLEKSSLQVKRRIGIR